MYSDMLIRTGKELYAPLRPQQIIGNIMWKFGIIVCYNKGSDVLADSIGSATLQTVDRIRKFDLAEKTKTRKQHARQAVEDSRAKIQAKLKDVERLNVLLDYNAKAHARIIKAFPGMKSLHSGGALFEVKLRVEELAQKK